MLQHIIPHIPAEEEEDQRIPSEHPLPPPLRAPPKPHFSLLSSSMSSASEKLSTWSPLGSGCTGKSRREGSAQVGTHREGDTGGTGRGAGLTGLVIQKVVLLHELPVQLQGLGCPGGVEDIGVLVEKLLEGVECGLAHLQRGQRTRGTEDARGKADTSMKPYLQQALAPQALTDPTLFSSCSSALLNSTLLWMAAMASGCSWRMAWQANLRGMRHENPL